jgi:hypothetical protein
MRMTISLALFSKFLLFHDRDGFFSECHHGNDHLFFVIKIAVVCK